MRTKALIIISLIIRYSGLYGQAPTGPFPYPTAPTASTNITAIEYYFDNDLPVPGAGTPLIGFVAGQNISGFSSNMTLPVGMPAGFHQAYIRTKDATGIWSLVQSVFFDNYTAPAYATALEASTNITAIEYYFDNDMPAFGAGTPLTGFTSGLNVPNFNSNLNLPLGMQAGFHRVYIRSKDALGKWSETENVYFDNFVAPAYATAPAVFTNIVAMEYFFDQENPLPGAGTPITGFMTGLNAPNFSTNLNLPSVFPGKFHKLYIRSKDALGKWSLTNNAYFDNYTVPAYANAPAAAPPVNKIEYFFDTDPGAGNGFMATSLPASSSNIMNFNFDAAIGTLQPGNHTIYIRSKQNPFSIANSGAFNKTAPALPINLISFNGKVTEKGNELIWETASEINNAYFEIEKSAPKKIKFEKIGEIKGANNSSEILIYTFLDENPDDESYYRLKQIDIDGKFAYSKIISVKNGKNETVTVFPNPFSEKINIKNKTNNLLTIKIFDEIGRIFNQKTSSDTNLTFETKDFQEGIFFIEITDGNKVKTKKLIKK